MDTPVSLFVLYTEQYHGFFVLYVEHGSFISYQVSVKYI